MVEVLRTGYAPGPVIVILKLQSQYGVASSYSDEISQAFRDLGHETVVFDTADPYGPELVKLLNAGKVKFVFDINGAGTTVRIEGKPIWDRAKTQLISLCGDSPVTISDRLVTDIHHWLVLFTNETWLALYRRGFPDRVKARSGLSYLGGRKFTDGPLKPIRDRRHGVTFVGSFYGTMDKATRVMSDSSLMSGLLRDTLAEAVEDGSRATVDIFASHLSKRGVDPNDVPTRSVYRAVQYIEERIRSFRRMRLLSSIRRVPVHLVGPADWKIVPELGSNFDVHPPVPFLQIGDLFGETKINLSMLPASTGGMHERTLCGMHHGAATLSDNSLEIPAEFQNGKNLYLYDWKDLAHMDDRLEAILADEASLSEVAEAGRAEVEAHYGWKNTAETILAASERHHYWLALNENP